VIFPWILGLSLALSALSLSAWRFSEDQDLVLSMVQRGLREELSQQAQRNAHERLMRSCSDSKE